MKKYGVDEWRNDKLSRIEGDGVSLSGSNHGVGLSGSNASWYGVGLSGRDRSPRKNASTNVEEISCKNSIRKKTQIIRKKRRLWKKNPHNLSKNLKKINKKWNKKWKKMKDCKVKLKRKWKK